MNLAETLWSRNKNMKIPISNGYEFGLGIISSDDIWSIISMIYKENKTVFGSTIHICESLNNEISIGESGQDSTAISCIASILILLDLAEEGK